jgi:FKBP-type peptidyl-prolyl cis-trans isomerase SlyD
MKIEANRVVAIEYTLKAEDGSLIDTTEGDEPLLYLHGSGQIVPGLEGALLGHVAGDTLTVTVAPDQGYGPRRNDRVLTVPRATLPDDVEIEVGMQLEATGRRGEHMVLWVEEINGDQVTLNGNHPLAGITLFFDVTVKEVREATREELAHGHPHGAHGHDHSHGHDHDHDH